MVKRVIFFYEIDWIFVGSNKNLNANRSPNFNRTGSMRTRPTSLQQPPAKQNLLVTRNPKTGRAAKTISADYGRSMKRSPFLVKRTDPEGMDSYLSTSADRYMPRNLI